MNSFPSHTSQGRFLLPSVAIMLGANSALAAHSAVDLQEQARQFIVATPGFESDVAAKSILTPAGLVQSQARLDPHVQARQFILAKPTFGSAVDLKTQGPAAGSAQHHAGVDPQEQARQFILPKLNLGRLADRLVTPVSKKRVTSALSVGGDRGGYSESR